jgi:hypothetical protein
MNTIPWKPSPAIEKEIDKLINDLRRVVQQESDPLIAEYCPMLHQPDTMEYRKLVELTTKMTIVGRACCEVAGFPFDERRRSLSILYGVCCFLADSFIDDYGEAVAQDYLNRFEILLTRGWFEVKSDREKLFYIALSRMTMLRDIMDPMLRQAIFALYEAQRRDVMLRLNAITFQSLPRSKQLAMLKPCARDRGGHTIMVLIRLVAPHLSLDKHHAVYLAGALFMYIDDHGDCWADRRSGRVTYMNQVADPTLQLRTLFDTTISLLRTRIKPGHGRDLMSGFLHRYFTTRLEKHEQEKVRGGLSWAVYE